MHLSVRQVWKKIKEDPFTSSKIRALTGENLITSCSDPVRKSKDAECHICVLSFPTFRNSGRGQSTSLLLYKEQFR